VVAIATISDSGLPQYQFREFVPHYYITIPCSMQPALRVLNLILNFFLRAIEQESASERETEDK
jgi:hypothetical protein